MMKHNVKEWKRQLLVASVLTVVSQAAFSAGPGTDRDQEIVRVTAQRVPAPTFQTAVEIDVKPLIESIDAQIEKQREAELKTIGTRRIELAISEVATRG